MLLEARTPDELLSSLASRVNDELDSGWVAILDTESELLLAGEGRPPAADWLSNSLRGLQGAASTGHDPGQARSMRTSYGWSWLGSMPSSPQGARAGSSRPMTARGSRDGPSGRHKMVRAEQRQVTLAGPDRGHREPVNRGPLTLRPSPPSPA